MKGSLSMQGCRWWRDSKGTRAAAFSRVTPPTRGDSWCAGESPFVSPLGVLRVWSDRPTVSSVDDGRSALAAVCRFARGGLLGDQGPVGGRRRSEPRQVFLESEPGCFLDDRIRHRAARSGCGEVAPPGHPFDEARFQHGSPCPGHAHDRLRCTVARPSRTSGPCSWPGRMSGPRASARRSSYASAVSQTGW